VCLSSRSEIAGSLAARTWRPKVRLNVLELIAEPSYPREHQAGIRQGFAKFEAFGERLGSPTPKHAHGRPIEGMERRL